MDEKHYISSVKLPENDTQYYLKDLDARALLEQLFSGEWILDCGTAEPYIEETGRPSPH